MNRAYRYGLILLALFCLSALRSQARALPLPELVNEQDTFPVPKPNKNSLFYVQRTSNTNTIMYDLNIKKDGTLDTESPVHVYWIRYADDGKKKELNYIQRKFAYGINSKKLGNDAWDLRFVSYGKVPLTLKKATDNNYYVYTKINNQQAILKKIFLKIDGGTFWVPNVVYVELKGLDPATGKEVSERFKP